MPIKRYDVVYDVRITVNSDQKEPTHTEILQALVDKAKFLAVNRSQIDGSITFRSLYDGEEETHEMPF